MPFVFDEERETVIRDVLGEGVDWPVMYVSDPTGKGRMESARYVWQTYAADLLNRSTSIGEARARKHLNYLYKVAKQRMASQ